MAIKVVVKVMMWFFTTGLLRRKERRAGRRGWDAGREGQREEEDFCLPICRTHFRHLYSVFKKKLKWLSLKYLFSFRASFHVLSSFLKINKYMNNKRKKFSENYC